MRWSSGLARCRSAALRSPGRPTSARAIQDGPAPFGDLRLVQAFSAQVGVKRSLTEGGDNYADKEDGRRLPSHLPRSCRMGCVRLPSPPDFVTN
jgi:hypothetical protein